MRPPILLSFLLAFSMASCRGTPLPREPDSPQASELKLLERQVASLRSAVEDAKKGHLFSPGDLAVSVSEEVAQQAASQALPIEKPIGTQFVARIERVSMSFASMQEAVRLEGRIWAAAEPGTYADLLLMGGIHDVQVERDTGVLTAEIVLDGWDVHRAAAVGEESEWIKRVVRLLGDRGVNALRDLVPPVRIPVGIEKGIDLPGISGGAVTIPAGHLPIDASVSRVLPLSGRLWAMIHITTSGWERGITAPGPTEARPRPAQSAPIPSKEPGN